MADGTRAFALQQYLASEDKRELRRNGFAALSIQSHDLEADEESSSSSEDSESEENPPSLTDRSLATTPSQPRTVSTGLLHNRQTYGFPINPEQAVLPAEPSAPVLHGGQWFKCPFFYLLCGRTFADEREWLMHSLIHLWQKPFPKSVTCPLTWCDELDHEFEDGKTAWQIRMQHVALHYQRGDQVILTKETARIKEQNMFRHLWNVGVIDEAQYQDLARTGMLRDSSSIQIERTSRRGRNDRRRGHGYVNG